MDRDTFDACAFETTSLISSQDHPMPTPDTDVPSTPANLLLEQIASAAGEKSPGWVTISPSLLVTVKVCRHEGKRISILCEGTALSGSGIRMSLSSEIGLKPGDTVEIELFLPSTTKPVATDVIVNSIRTTNNMSEDTCVVEAEFLTQVADRKIRAFLRDHHAFESHPLV